jgi:hypothetical protein
MDVFALHIPMHQVPAPLVTMLTTFLLVRRQPRGRGRTHPSFRLRARLAAVLALAAPVPADLQDLRGERAPPPLGLSQH